LARLKRAASGDVSDEEEAWSVSLEDLVVFIRPSLAHADQQTQVKKPPF